METSLDSELAAHVRLAQAVLAILRAEGPDGCDRMESIAAAAVAAGFGAVNQDANDDTDPWLVPKAEGSADA